MIRKILMAVLVIALGLYVYYLINSSPDKVDVVPSADSGFVHLLAGNEFSALAYYKGMIYAGGIQGFYIIDPKTYQYTELKENEKSFENVRSIYPDHDVLWVGHENGITIFTDGNAKRIGKEDGLTDPQVIDLLRIDETTMYASTYSGVAKISGSDISYITTKDDLPANTIKTMFKDSFGWVWMGAYSSRGGGILCKKGDKTQLFDIKNGLVHNSITSIVETPDHKILVGGGVFTEGGANILEYVEDQWKITKTIKKEDGLAGEKVRNIFIDDLKSIWFCSEYDGVAIFKENGEKTIITENSGLSNNEVKKLVQDGNKNFWLATKSGITFIDKAFLYHNAQ